MESFQAAFVNIWDQLGVCLREDTSVIAGKSQSKVPSTSIRPREWPSLDVRCTHRVLLTAGELKAKTNAREQAKEKGRPLGVAEDSIWQVMTRWCCCCSWLLHPNLLPGSATGQWRMIRACKTQRGGLSEPQRCVSLSEQSTGRSSGIL